MTSSAVAIDVAVVDYGMGNLRSVAKALEHVAPQSRVVVTQSADDLQRAARVVVPGQGAMPDCMAELAACNLTVAIKRAARDKPFLGICIGLHMLFETSEEGNVAGLGILPGRVRRLPKSNAEQGLKTPHMGWNQVRQIEPHPLWNGITDQSRFYFVHSFYAEPLESQLVAGQTQHGIHFASAVARANIFATQFHPEKSAHDGLRLLANFMTWNP